ncbi:MAG: hypothetical protein ACI87E_003654 [Mariniblastus sp.]|jgi:hypothetical protein
MRPLAFICVLLSLAAVGCSKKAREAPMNLDAAEAQIWFLTESEEQIEALGPHYQQLTKWLADPAGASDDVFGKKLRYLGPQNLEFDSLIKKSGPKQNQLGTHIEWPLENSKKYTTVQPAAIWAPILKGHQLEGCSLGTLAGTFVTDDLFETETKFEARLRGKSGQPMGVKGYQTLEWTKDKNEEWSLTKWTQTKLELVVGAGPIFKDVTATAIPDQKTLKKIQNSSQTDLLIELSKQVGDKGTDFTAAFRGKYDDWESAYQYPGVSVVDIDQDGFDDLFVTDRWQSAQLLRNQGDGTFQDITESSGLNVKDLAVCGVFADFDNDGDSDVFVGRTREPSQFFENIDGVFHLDESQADEYKYLRYVVSGSVIDVNGDGLLDLYLNTYGFPTDANVWTGDTFRPQDRKKLQQKVTKQHWFIDRGGAANVLMLNMGGKLKRVEIDDNLAQWRNSFQTVWSDYDNDGDHDLYICNDFAPDYFLRNDTVRGSSNPVFSDVSQEMVSGGTMGFGMGASWGDYNNDGLLDLYVSNMYSKAGNRIVKQIDDVDERIKVSAKGSFLYENTGGKFKQVSGDDQNSQHVSVVGWSFGGQFADFDNDGELDLYVPSGYYTPPKEIQQTGDL